MSALLPYTRNIDIRSCPKCGNDPIVWPISYRRRIGTEGDAYDERLVIECLRCGFERSMKTKDAPEEEEKG